MGPSPVLPPPFESTGMFACLRDMRWERGSRGGEGEGERGWGGEGEEEGEGEGLGKGKGRATAAAALVHHSGAKTSRPWSATMC